MLDYLNRSQEPVNRLELVGNYSDRIDHAYSLTHHNHLQLLGIIRGLNYLHTHQVVHGDLKGVRMISLSLPPSRSELPL